MKTNILFFAAIAGLAYWLYTQITNPSTALGGAVQSAGNVAVNAATGSLTQNQVDAAIQSETQLLINAGASPAVAALQAQADQTALQNLPQPTYWDGVKAAFLDIF